jgi:thiol:disulfide interchange protein DsbD
MATVNRTAREDAMRRRSPFAERRTRPRRALLALLLMALTAMAVTRTAAAAPEPPKVTVDLVSAQASIAPGQTFWIGLRQQIAPGWHTYWTNPGDSGEAPQIEWRLPAGFTAGEIAWPHPERIPAGPAMTYGYSDEVVLPIPVTAPKDLAVGGQVTLAGRASWLVCEKECIPEEAPVSLTLPVAAAPSPPHPTGAALIENARRAVPSPSPWAASFTVTPDAVTLTIAARGLAAERVADAYFFPARWGVIDQTAPQLARVDPSGVRIKVARGPLPEATAAPIDGVLVLTERLDQGTADQAFSVRAMPGTGSAGVSIWQAIALALAGGLILNLMPCVLPVLSVKALGLVQHASASRSALRWQGALYTGGVLAAFAVVAGTLIALRAAGDRIGWGFQLQSPLFVTLLAYLIFAMALALSGVFAIGGRLTGTGQALAARPGYAGSFFTGALAAVAATPCTAPFMGVAVGFAVTQPWPIALLVFEALALGLALPYLLLTLIPAWRRFLPRPGAWMTRLEQALAFPLYATVAWLVWVLSQQAGPTGVGAALAGLVLIALAAWLYTASRDARVTWRRVGTGAVAALVAAAIAVSPWSAASIATPARGSSDEAFSPRRLAELRQQGKPVFVNVTAAWCITCLVNERVALRTAAVTDAFARKGVVMLKADWTNRDPSITEVLGSFGRSGVPLYLLYPATGEPAVLPQILSEGAVIEAVHNI